MRRATAGCVVWFVAVLASAAPLAAETEGGLYRSIRNTARTTVSSRGRSRDQYIRLLGEQARTIVDKCETYRKDYPDGEHLPEVLAFQAKATVMSSRLTNSKPTLAKAAETAQVLVDKYPKSPSAAEGYTVLAENALVHKKIEDALTYAQKVVDEFPKSSDAPLARFFVAIAYDEQGKNKECIETLETIVKLHKGSSVYAQADNMLFARKLKGSEMKLKFVASDGRKVDLKKLRGKVVLIDFWATWCPPCRAEIPALIALRKELHDKGFRIVGISLDSGKSAMNRFIKETGMTWPSYYDGKGWGNLVAKKYRIRSIPTTFLLDKQGKIREIGLHGGALAGAVRKLLDEKE